MLERQQETANDDEEAPKLEEEIAKEKQKHKKSAKHAAETDDIEDLKQKFLTKPLKKIHF